MPAAVAGLIVLGTLLLSGLAHLRRPGPLRSAVTSHRILPAPAGVAVAVTLAEVAAGAAGAVAVARADTALLRSALAGAALLCLAYAAYSWQVTRSGVAAPCGCSGPAVPMSGWVTTRALALAALALAALAAGPRPAWTGGEAAVALLAAATLGLALWQLPAALHDPVRTRGGLAPR
jgi:Methylamine utilisation protein MauE